MTRMKLLLVGGFLASGKTTAIYGAAKLLKASGRKAGILTNDQGKQQVDTGFIRGKGFPNEEVAGSCFCCNFNAMATGIQRLQENTRTDIIFAESVGSCADLAATIINPLLTLQPDQYNIVLSVFADIRLLLAFLNEHPVFHGDVSYIYQKQLDEADIIVANKADLLSARELDHAKAVISDAFSGKTILYQNSLSEEGIQHWLDTCENFHNATLRPALSIDYDKYGAGEAELAWLDEEIGIASEDKNAVKAALLLADTIYNKIKAGNYPIGHLKFLLDNGHHQTKISFGPFDTNALEQQHTTEESSRAVLLVNARVQTTPKALQDIITEAIVETENTTACKITEYTVSAFQPGYPRPTYRIIA
jgi:G3E family GTPase